MPGGRLRSESYLLDDFETVAVVAVENVWAHECKNGHDIIKYGFGRKTSQVGDQKECLMERLRISRYWGIFNSLEFVRSSSHTYLVSLQQEYPTV